MAIETTNYKCPACTGPLHFAGDSGRLECEYCGSSYDISEFEAKVAEELREAEAEAAQAQAQGEEEAFRPSDEWGEEASGMRAYTCPSCGAELICDATTAATSCPYCGNPSILPGQFTGIMKPELVIPFKLDKQAAVNALKNYYKGKKFLPNAFADKNHIEEIKGVYVPFWIFEGSVDADKSYAATRVHSHVRGNERITTTEHYSVRRSGRVDFSGIPVDASSKMPDTHMDAIEPFDYSELRDFTTAYLAGYMADKYDVEAAVSQKRAEVRACNSVEGLVDATVMGYSSCMPTGKRIKLSHCKAKYVLLPVWMLSTSWKGQRYLFAMNGQTGKLIGDLPVDMGKYWKTFASIAAPLAAVMAAIMFFI